MIDIILIFLGMCILGYSFYESIKIISELKDHKMPSLWKFSMKFAAVFALTIFFVVTLVFFGSVYSPLAESFSRAVFGSFFFAGAVIATLTVKVNSMVLRNTQQTSAAYRKMYENAEESKEELERKVGSMERDLQNAKPKGGKEAEIRIRELQKELEELKKITKHAVGRELRMVELKNEIRSLKEQLKKKSE